MPICATFICKISSTTIRNLTSCNFIKIFSLGNFLVEASVLAIGSLSPGEGRQLEEDEKLHNLIGLIYESAIDESLWPELLDQLSSHVDLSSIDERLPYVESSKEAGVRDILISHFRRATGMNQKLAQVQGERSAATSVLDRLPVGILFAKEGGEVSFANVRARAIFESNDNLFLQKGILKSSSAHTSRLIGRSINLALSGAPNASNSVNLSTSPRLTLSISQVPDHSSHWDHKPNQVIIFIVTPDAPTHISPSGLQKKYSLAPAEARLTLALINEGSLGRAANSLGISIHTARSYLKTILFNTGYGKQTELISRLLRSHEALIADSPLSTMNSVVKNKDWRSMPRRRRLIRLYDGRELCFAEYGDPEGIPVIMSHGAVSSRLQMHPDEQIAIDAGCRLIVPDRPGIGGSDPKEGLSLLDLPNDIIQLADRLELDRFAMIGLTSGGGPTVLSCAYTTPHRLTAVSIVSGRATPELMMPAPSVRVLLGMARFAPSLLHQFLKIMVQNVIKCPESYLELRLSDHAEVDQRILRSEIGHKVITEPLKEALVQGADGIAWDLCMGMCSKLELTEIEFPILFWQGTEDLIVPTDEVQRIASKLPNAEIRMIEGQGQYLFIPCWREILDDISSRHKAALDSDAVSLNQPAPAFAHAS